MREAEDGDWNSCEAESCEVRSAADIQEIFRGGVPSGGMPAFKLPAEQLGAVAAYVYSLNSTASENPLSGDPEQDRQVSFRASARIAT